MQQYFATMFEDIRHEISLTILPSLPDPDKLEPSKFTDQETILFRNLASEKIHVQRFLIACIAVSIMD